MQRRVVLVVLFLLTLAATASCGGGDKSERLVVVDLNILHGIGGDGGGYERIFERINLIATALAEIQPDVVFLQEVLVGTEGDYPDVRGILLAALGDNYHTVFGELTGREIGDTGLGQLTLTRLPITGSNNRGLSAARSVQRLTVETASGPLDLYNTHLEGSGAIVGVTADDALAEIGWLLSFIEESSGRPVLLGGDFNSLPESRAMQTLRDTGFIDAMAAGGDAACVAPGDPGCTSSTRPLSDNPENMASKRIDYVWTRNSDDLRITVEMVEPFLNVPDVLNGGGLLWPSDHIGVLAVLRLE